MTGWRIIRGAWAALFVCWAMAVQAQDGSGLSEDLAQQDDQGFLAGLLEQSLGGEGREVRITGFRGALSSTAEIDRITIADPQGVWLTMDGLSMEWSRAALLRGRIDITALRAGSIVLDRPPATPDTGLPEAEASGFALPDLPVAIDIKAVEVERFALGAAVLGAGAELSLSAAGLFDGDALSLRFDAARIDGQDGQFVVDARYVQAADTLALTLSLDEGAGGIAARLLNLPDTPAVALSVDGTGPLSDYVMDIDLDTGGADRVDGAVRLSGAASQARKFDVDLTGDIAPLVSANFRAFFGNATQVSARGTRAGDGGLDLDTLTLETGTLALSGALRLGADGWPEAAGLDVVLRDSTGAPVTLPVSGGTTRVARADLTVRYDAATDDAWDVDGTIVGFDTDQVQARQLQLTGAGQIEARTTVRGRMSVQAIGLDFATEAVQRAAGDTISGAVDLRVAAGTPVTLSNLAIRGADYSLTGDINLSGLDSSFETGLDLRLVADDLARFGPLAGADLNGAANVTLRGTVDAGGGADLTIDGRAQSLATGIAQIDGLLAGETRLSLLAQRDGDGARVPRLALSNPQLSVTASAALQSGVSDVTFDLTIPDGTRIDPLLSGAVTLAGTATQRADTWRVDARATAPYDAEATVEGAVTGPAPEMRFALSLPDVASLVPDISGPLQLDGTALPTPEGWTVEMVAAGPYAARASVQGRLTGAAAPDVAFNLALPDVRPLVPGVSGALSVSGQAQQRTDGLAVNTSFSGPLGSSGTVSGQVTGATPRLAFALSLADIAALGSPVGGRLALTGQATQVQGAWRVGSDIAGPGGATARIEGTVASADAINMSLRGDMPLALATPLIAPRSLQGTARFDLAVAGPAALQNLSGQISTRGARLSAPTVAVALNGLDADITLRAGQAQIDAAGDVSSGGRISVQGRTGLTGTLPADITARLSDVRLTDPTLYETLLNGAISLRGPLSGGAVIAGQIDVGETQVQVPNASGGGFTIIPDVVHVDAQPAVRQTLARAGLNQAAEAPTASTTPGFGLDIAINAPARVFVRGRGLDTELGGQLNLRGTTNNVVSVGRFELIRGRLDILGKRFALDEGAISLQGQLDPFLRFVATTPTDAGSASVIIEGPATSPEVTFQSTPAAPQDEVLAQIFFGRSLSTLSPFQALQLASAVAQLAGQGGEGVVSRLRRGFGLDDLDITTDEQGGTGLRFGKYLSDNVYTDVTVGDNEDAGVSLNIDLTPSLTARGTQKADGNSSIGIFFERDY